MIAKAAFGSTGHESTRTIFGAAALAHVSQAEADRALDLLVEHGVNHIDTAASYGDSELRLAPWLAQEPCDDVGVPCVRVEHLFMIRRRRPPASRGMLAAR